MDINKIIDFLCEEKDRIFPFMRTFKILDNLSEIGNYIKVNLKSNITLEELGNKLNANIIIIDNNLDLFHINNGFDKYICLIKHNDKYEFTFIMKNNKMLYIYDKSELKNIKFNELKIYDIKKIFDENEYDNSDDYEEIIDTVNTLDSIILENVQTNIIDIIKKEFGNNINLEDLNEIDKFVLTDKDDKKIVDGFIIPKELINMDYIKLKKMLKNDIINSFKKINPNISASKYTKITKDKLIEMIKK